MTEAFLPISIAILVFTIIVSAIVIGIKAFKDKSKKTLPMRTLWHAYLYIMTILSLALFLYGGMRFTRAMLAKYVTPYFSYTTNLYEKNQAMPIDGKETYPVNEAYDPVLNGQQKIVEYNGKEYAYDFSTYKSDIVDGLTMFVSLFVIFAVHRFLIYRSDREEDSFFKKIYDFVGLAQYGVLSIVTLPFGIYSLVRYFTEDLNLNDYGRPLPGAAIAMLLFVLPTWIVFLVRMAKQNKSEGTN